MVGIDIQKGIADIDGTHLKKEHVSFSLFPCHLLNHERLSTMD